MSTEAVVIILIVLCCSSMALLVVTFWTLSYIRKRYHKLCDLTSNFVVDPAEAREMSEVEILDNLEKYFMSVLHNTNMRVDPSFDSDVISAIKGLK